MSAPVNSELDVLMYHSISEGDGPTCISADTFRMQLDLLKELGYQSVTLDDVVAWKAGQTALPPRPVLITFDDGFQDFADVAWPRLSDRGFGAVVFVPTGRMGGGDDWEDAPNRTARTLMAWEDVRDLGEQGVEFGAHSVHHCDLTQLSASEVRHEVEVSRRELEEQLGRPVVSFAPPYGRSTAANRLVIGRSYRLSFGTSLARATTRSDFLNLPRVEMHYFRSAARWRAHLQGGGRWWLVARRSMRTARQASLELFQNRFYFSSSG